MTWESHFWRRSPELFFTLFSISKKNRVQSVYFFMSWKCMVSSSLDCLNMPLTTSAQVGPPFRKPVQFRIIKQDLAVLLCLVSNEVWERPTIPGCTRLTDSACPRNRWWSWFHTMMKEMIRFKSKAQSIHPPSPKQSLIPLLLSKYPSIHAAGLNLLSTLQPKCLMF